MNAPDIDALCEIARVEFSDIVTEAFRADINECRILLKDGSLIDVWYSLKLSGRYSYHWERRAVDGTIFRHDNMAHKNWESVKTFPKHFHHGSEGEVEESHISESPVNALRMFLDFARGRCIHRELVEENGIRVVGVLDERYADEMFNGVPMWRAEELPEGEWDGVLITALEDLDTVEAQLREMGLAEERIWRLS